MSDTNTSSLVVLTPTAESLLSPADLMLRNCEALEVTDQFTAEFAARELREIVARKKTRVEERLAITRKIDATKQDVMVLYRKPIELLERAEGILRGKIKEYLRQEEERAAAEQRRIEDLQRKARQQAEADAAKAQAEADERERKLRAEAEAARAAGDEKKAVRLDNRANAVVEQAQAVVHDKLSAATAMIAAPAVAPAPKLPGISQRKNYGAECVDFDLLIEYLATEDGKRFRSLVKLDQAKLDAQGRSQDEHFNIPGCRLVDRDNLAVRTK